MNSLRARRVGSLMWLTSVAGWVGWQALQALRRAGISAGGRWGWGAAEAIRGA
eukprot:COSAG01_NODE_7504_length_3177_cov_5.605067_1_plen_52_part_10